MKMTLEKKRYGKSSFGCKVFEEHGLISCYRLAAGE
jgi:hypothetical protein